MCVCVRACVRACVLVCSSRARACSLAELDARAHAPRSCSARSVAHAYAYASLSRASLCGHCHVSCACVGTSSPPTAPPTPTPPSQPQPPPPPSSSLPPPLAELDHHRRRSVRDCNSFALGGVLRLELAVRRRRFAHARVVRLDPSGSSTSSKTSITAPQARREPFVTLLSQLRQGLLTLNSRYSLL